MNIIIKFITSKSRPYIAFTPVGVVLHDTATPGATPENEYNYFQHSAPQASAHIFVGWDSIIQIIPFNEKAWHAGPTANKRYIGVELCNPKEHNVEQFNKVWENGIQVFVYLYKNIIKKPCNSDTFWTHARISNTFHETDHQDPISFFKSYGRTVEEFETEVQKRLGQITSVAKSVIIPTATTVSVSTVTQVQTALNTLGYICGKADGVIGNKTVTALKAFQASKGLVADGVAGPKTKSALAEAINKLKK
jgi:N-acetylmuramoyl-L-alanine amidase CwlA